MNIIDNQSWKADMPAFIEKTEAFYAGELPKNDYKGFSGFYGSYAQKGGEASMLRLRMTAGRVTKEKLAYVADAVQKYGVKRAHFTTCEAIQLHDLKKEQIYPIMENALDHDIVCMGGGGDFPRNVMCAPLSGVEKDEYFDVRPYAETAGKYLMNFIKAEKMPRKLKVCFSNSPKNVPHATFRDLGFVAREDGKFDVYSAGGLGPNPRFGVKVAEGIDPEMYLYYIKAMWMTFRAYGCYENRGKARTRYMQEICGSPEEYKAAYQAKLKEVMESGEDLKVTVEADPVTKKGDGSAVAGTRVMEQKQEGLYTVAWHPIGGNPDLDTLIALSNTIADMDAVEMRLSPDETAYIINLTGEEAKKVLAVTAEDTAKTLFETSVSCIGAATCQVGLRDSQALLRACVAAVKEAGIKDGALPQIHISGCPSSCGTHQIGSIGFRGATKSVDKKAQSAYVLYVGGNDAQGQEAMGRELGTVLETKVPELLVKIGKAAMAADMTYAEWIAKNPEGVDAIAAEYIA